MQRVGVAVAVVLLALATQSVEAVRCQIPKTANVKGGPVSWWIGYKVLSHTPQDGQEFVWLSSQHKSGSAYEVHATSQGPLETTLNQLSSKAPSYAALSYIKWNDQPPGSSVTNKLFPDAKLSGEPGHSKGVIASTYTRGFYLTHSWPQFPDPGTASGYSSKDSRPDAITQAFFCFSVDLTGETPEKIQNHLGLIRPGIYDSYPPNLNTLNPAWEVILDYPRDASPPTDFMAKDVIPLIADATLQSEGPAASPAASAPKPTEPANGKCGGGASCLYRRAQIAKNSGVKAPVFSAGSVQLFASSVSNTPGTFWSAFRKWVFPGRPFTIQTWVSAAINPNDKLNENLFLSAPLKSTIMSYACFPSSQGASNSVANCRERRELHSKVAVSQSQAFPVTCFADLNMEQTRSGGMICLQSEPVRSLVSESIYALPKPIAAGTSALPPAVSFARVDKCVSATTTSCTITTQVESLAAAYTYSEAHSLPAVPVTPAPTTALQPPANNPVYSADACALNPLPCPAFPGRSTGPVIAVEAPSDDDNSNSEHKEAKSSGKEKTKGKAKAKAGDSKKAPAKEKAKAKAKAKAKSKTKKPTKQKALL